MAYIALGKIRHNGKRYGVGDPIQGLKKDEVERLEQLGAIEVLDDNDQQEVNTSPNDLLSVEEFSRLKAGEQAEHLKIKSIEPAGNAEERLKQYTDWLAEQVKVDDNA